MEVEALQGGGRSPLKIKGYVLSCSVTRIARVLLFLGFLGEALLYLK